MKLRMFFYGICGFVPDSIFPDETRMSAVLVDASDPSKGHPGAMEHTAKLYYRKDGAWQPEDLNRVLVTVGNPHPDEQPLRARAQPLPAKNKPSEVDNSWRAVWWLASVARIDRQAAVVRDDVLKEPGQSVSDRIAARISMPLGVFELADLARYKGSFFSWTFMPTPSGHAGYQQALAMKSLWQLQLSTDTAELRLTDLDDTSVAHLSIPSNADGHIDIIVANLSKEGHESLFSTGNGMGQGIDTDLDFRWFYRLSQNPGSDQPVPVPEDTVLGNTASPIGLNAIATADPIGGGPVRCPQTLFAPHRDAGLLINEDN